MPTRTPFSLRSILLHTFLFGIATTAFADTASDMAEMQKQLNAETMNKPFQVEDASKVDSYIKDAMKKDLKPDPTPPANWGPGYTCDSYYHHYSYNYYGYRNCMYYHHYYGRYW